MIQALTISQVIELTQEIKPILALAKEVDQTDVQGSAMEFILENLDKAIPVLVVLSCKTETEESIRAMTLVDLTKLIDEIIEANGVEELLGLFSKISQRFNKGN
jgi:hypothetical protein